MCVNRFLHAERVTDCASFLSAGFARGWLRKSQNRAREEGKKPRKIHANNLYFSQNSRFSAHTLTHCAAQYRGSNCCGRHGTPSGGHRVQRGQDARAGERTQFFVFPRCKNYFFSHTKTLFSRPAVGIPSAQSHSKKENGGSRAIHSCIHRVFRACAHMF